MNNNSINNWSESIRNLQLIIKKSKLETVFLSSNKGISVVYNEFERQFKTLDKHLSFFRNLPICNELFLAFIIEIEKLELLLFNYEIELLRASDDRPFNITDSFQQFETLLEKLRLSVEEERILFSKSVLTEHDKLKAKLNRLTSKLNLLMLNQHIELSRLQSFGTPNKYPLMLINNELKKTVQQISDIAKNI